MTEPPCHENRRLPRFERCRRVGVAQNMQPGACRRRAPILTARHPAPRARRPAPPSAAFTVPLIGEFGSPRAGPLPRGRRISSDAEVPSRMGIEVVPRRTRHPVSRGPGLDLRMALSHQQFDGPHRFMPSPSRCDRRRVPHEQDRLPLGRTTGLRLGKQRQALGRLQRVGNVREPVGCADALSNAKLRLQDVAVPAVCLEALLVPPLFALPPPPAALGHALGRVRGCRPDHDTYQRG